MDELSDVKFKCPECGGERFVEDHERAELTCLGCGLVVREKMVDTGPEWRAFDLKQYSRRARIGAPLTHTIHDRGLSTIINLSLKDSTGKELSPTKRLQIYRLIKQQQRTRVSSALDRNLTYALSELDRIGSQLELPKNVLEEAALIYRRAVSEKLVRGRSIESMVTASLYAACKKFKLPRTLDEVAAVARVKKREIGRAYRFLLRRTSAKVSFVTPVKYVPKIVSKLGLPGEVQAEAIKILEKASEAGLTSGRGPMGVVAAAVYIASILLQHKCKKCKQKDVAIAANVTEVTIRNRYKEIMERLDFIVEL
ncbi:MAG: transcription initiation factor IIB [Candidatus Nezhaarchaeales archaeon]